MVQYRRLLYFVLFLVGITMFLVGTLGWVIGADQDYSITYTDVTSDPPRSVNGERANIGTYDSLTETQKAKFHRAVDDGEVIHYETADQMWPNVIRSDGKYYAFSEGGHFDWFDPFTLGTVLAAIVGLVTTVQTARMEYRLY